VRAKRDSLRVADQSFSPGSESWPRFPSKERVAQKCLLQRSILWAGLEPRDSRQCRGPVRRDAHRSVQMHLRACRSFRSRNSVTVLIPSLTNFSSVTFPTPGMRPTGKGKRNASTSSGWITNSPSGFRQSDASFAGTCSAPHRQKLSDSIPVGSARGSSEQPT